MAEVSHIRNAATRTRPLGEVKDDIAYMVEPDSRYAHRENYDQDSDDQKMKDVKESIRHAALINIVAAVNDSCDDEATNSHLLEQTNRSTENNMTLISNLVFHRDRSISIPKPQLFFEPPETLSTKKPLFYRNSKDEAPEDIEHRKRCVSLTRTRVSVDEESDKALPERPTSERLQFSVSIQRLRDSTKTEPPNPPWLEKPAKVKNARSMSPRRRFVSLNKKIDSKLGTTISKCEAVDIMDATECLHNRIKPPVSHIESYGEQVEHESDSSMYRARSLPSLFPVKKKKETKVSEKNESAGDKEKSKLISPFKRPSATAYGCLPNMVMGKTIQTKTEIGDSTLIQEQKLYSRVEKVSSAIKETISKFDTSTMSTEPSKSSGAVISLEGHSIPNPRNTNVSASSQPWEKRLLSRPQTGPDYMKMNSAQERSISHDFDHHFHELHKTLAQRSSQWSAHMNPSTQSANHDIANYGLVGKKFKSKIGEKMASEKSKTLTQKMGFKPKSTKRVTFAPVEDTFNNSSGSEYKNLTNSVCEERQDSSKTKRAINQVNVRIGSSSMKAVSSGELSRLKKRILPEEFNSDTKPKYDLLDNIRISGMSSREGSVPPRPPSRMSDVRSMASEGASSSYFDEVAFDWNRQETDAADRASSSVPKSYGASSFYPDSTKLKLNFNHYNYDDSDDSSDEEEDDTYRIVKAVDLGTLSGFQHRKFRKPTTKLETSTTHFVKIRVK